MEPAELAARTRRWLRGASVADIVIVLKAIHEELALRIMRWKWKVSAAAPRGAAALHAEPGRAADVHLQVPARGGQ